MATSIIKDNFKREIDSKLPMSRFSGAGTAYVELQPAYTIWAMQFPNNSVTQLAFYATGKVAILRKKADGSWGSETVLRNAD